MGFWHTNRVTSGVDAVNSNSNVLVVQPADEGMRHDAPTLLTGRETGASLFNERCVLSVL